MDSLGILPAFPIFTCNGDFAGSEGSQWGGLGVEHSRETQTDKEWHLREQPLLSPRTELCLVWDSKSKKSLPRGRECSWAERELM